MSSPLREMGIKSLVCTHCGLEHGLDMLYKCPACEGTLDAQYYTQPDQMRALFNSASLGKRESMWTFSPLLPVDADRRPVSLGEGWTPLLKVGNASNWFSLVDIHLKIEAANPTGSFKDRPVSVALTKACELGLSEVVTASSGNAGVSVAAYSARAGLNSVVIVPDGLPPSKLVPISLCGARVIAVRGHYSRAYQLARAWAEETGAFNVTSTLLSAFTTEGNKTVAYELWLQLKRVPDWILVPVSSGPLLVGTFKGYVEMHNAGLIDRLPRMVAVQASGCAPIARAFDRGDERVVPWDEPNTVARGIADPLQGYEDDGTLTLRRVRESGGVAMDVSDLEILEAVKMLARLEGLLVEPTGAVAAAGLKRLIASGRIKPGESAVCLITGHGLKDPISLGRELELAKPPAIEPTIKALRSSLRAL